MLYESLLKYPSWIKKRNEILARDNHQCKNCGSKTNLQVHHRQYHINKSLHYFKLPWKYDEKYLITLCDKCHAAGHLKFKIPVFSI